RFRRQPIDPFAGWNRLASRLVSSLGGPVSLCLDLFVGDRAFHDEHERIEPALGGAIEMPHELLAAFVGEYRVVQMDFGKTGKGTEGQVFDARLAGRGHRNRVPVATEARRQPDDMYFLHRGNMRVEMAVLLRHGRLPFIEWKFASLQICP